MTHDNYWLDSVYADYDNWKGWSAEDNTAQQARLIDIELRRSGIQPPAKVLEIGFGTGAFLIHLNSRGYECWGIERRVEHNRHLESFGISVRTGSLSDLIGEQFDLICAMDVLEHLEKPQLLQMMREIRGLLKPGGRFLARFPNCSSPFGLMNQHADLTHMTPLSPSAFSQACSVVGLRYVGGWNSATSWRADSLGRSLLKPVILAARRIAEALVSILFFGDRRPLDANVTVCAERPDDSE